MKKRSWYLTIGGVLTACMLAFTATGLFWTPYVPSAMDKAARNAAPSLAHPFGCDSMGRDILSRTLEGAGSTLAIALAVLALGAVCGLAVGALCVRLQCLVMPIHGWVAVANMFCAGLGEARGALILSSARQGTCFIPVVYPLSWAFGATGVASVQAVADVLSLVLAIPIVRGVLGRVKQAEETLATESAPLGGLQSIK